MSPVYKKLEVKKQREDSLSIMDKVKIGFQNIIQLPEIIINAVSPSANHSRMQSHRSSFTQEAFSLALNPILPQ